MSKTKNVFFNFFRSTTYEEESGINKRLELHELLDGIKREYELGEREEKTDYKIIYTYNDEPALLTDISFDVGYQVYHLVFERLVYNVPNRTSIYGDSEAIILADNEYIGHEVSVI